MKFLCLSFLLCIPYLLSSQSDDSLAIKVIDSLIQVSRNLTGIYNFDKALEINLIAEKLALEKFSRESVAYGNACFNHGRIMYGKKDFKESESWYLESKKIREKLLGVENLDYAWSLSNLANLYKDIGQFDKAESFFLQAKEIRGKVLGKDHVDYANSLINLGILYRILGRFIDSEKMYIEANLVLKINLGPNHPNYAGGLINLASLYMNMGKFESAQNLFMEARSIFESNIKYLSHPFYMNCLNNLATLYKESGQYEMAEVIYLKLLNLKEKYFGKEHPEYAAILINLANLYSEIGSYQQAELFYLDAKQIFNRKEISKNNLDYISCLISLGNLNRTLGQCDKAEKFLLESKQKIGEILGKNSPDYANILNNLGELSIEKNEMKLAEEYFLEARAILKNILNGNYPDYISNLYYLGKLYLAQGNYQNAEKLFFESKELFEKIFGVDNPKYANILDNIGLFYSMVEDFNIAEYYFVEANKIRDSFQSKQHPDFILHNLNMAILYSMLCKSDKAMVLFNDFEKFSQMQILSALNHLSEYEMNKYLLKFESNQSRLFSLSQTYSCMSEISKINYNDALFFKGILLNAYNMNFQFLFKDSSMVEKFNLFKSYGRLRAKEYSKLFAEQKNLADIEIKSNDLEKYLFRNIPDYNKFRQRVQWKEVQSILQLQESAIEFVHYNYFNKKQTDSNMYAALVLLPNDTTPHFVTLFDEKELNKLLAYSQSKGMDYVSDVYHSPSSNIDSSPLYQNRSLYELIWKPLEPYLKGVNKIYFSPSGLLHRINQNAIAINDHSLLSDKYDLVQLGSTRQLVTNKGEVNSKIIKASIYGGINFEMDSTALMATHHEIDTNGIALRSELSFSYTDSTLRGGSWNYLIGSEQEANDINRIIHKAGIKSALFKGKDATEEAFKKLGDYKTESPQIIHISTHGYFFPDPKVSRHPSAVTLHEEPVFKISEHPLLRSGLIMAGANHAWKTGKPITQEAEDGILTAYEISQLNLRNTELVVLSACETGLGDIQGNEGVYGLQRAFKIAGVKNLIMSLWQVPDQQTSELMTSFYKYWLINKKSIRESLKLAQYDLRKKGLEPFFWAGFVLVE